MSERWLIRIIAGVNGAGKSSIGDALRRRGGEYWNPDRATERLLEANPELSLREANIAAWEAGRDRLRAAIRDRRDLVFETTLGGRTITGILQEGIESGAPVHIIYIGLEGVDLHVHRVRLRVEKGGHDIPESRIRERYRHSRENLIRLLPGLARLDLYDNTREAKRGQRVTPVRVLALVKGRIEHCLDPEAVPAWARSIVMRTIKLDRWPASHGRNRPEAPDEVCRLSDPEGDDECSEGARLPASSRERQLQSASLIPGRPSPSRGGPTPR